MIGMNFLSLNKLDCLYLENGYMTIMAKDKLIEITKKAISLVILEDKTCGTGFFIKLPIPTNEKPMYGIMTNNHVINSEYIKSYASFKIKINNESYIIDFNESNFIFTSELIDITFIQLNVDFIKHYDFIFLEPCYDEPNKNEMIYIFQYPKAKLSFASGYIEDHFGFNYFHNTSTNRGSSGSPLLNKFMKVVGVHKIGISTDNGDINLATDFTTIDYAIRTLYNKSYINEIIKAKEPTRSLTKHEDSLFKKYGLEKTPLLNMYYCPYIEYPSSVLLFYRTNHAWYFTRREKSNICYHLDNVKTYNWTLINTDESFTKALENKFSKDESFTKTLENKFNKDESFTKTLENKYSKKLEHHHELLITWLKLSELMYM